MENSRTKKSKNIDGQIGRSKYRKTRHIDQELFPSACKVRDVMPNVLPGSSLDEK